MTIKTFSALKALSLEGHKIRSTFTQCSFHCIVIDITVAFSQYCLKLFDVNNHDLTPLFEGKSTENVSRVRIKENQLMEGLELISQENNTKSKYQ